MQASDKKNPVIDIKNTGLREDHDVRGQSIRAELKRIRAEAPDLYKALSLDKFD